MHLTTDEILNFITMESITQDSIAFAAKVNSHIMQCEDCRKKVEAFQMLNDGLTGTTLSCPGLHKDSISKSEPEKGNEII